MAPREMNQYLMGALDWITEEWMLGGIFLMENNYGSD
jgi:hypothetical protein